MHSSAANSATNNNCSEHITQNHHHQNRSPSEENNRWVAHSKDLSSRVLSSKRILDHSPETDRMRRGRGEQGIHWDRLNKSQRAELLLKKWVASCQSSDEQFNRKHIAQVMLSQGVYINENRQYQIDGDLFCFDDIGLIAPHSPLSLPNNLYVTGKLDLGFFSGLKALPQGLEVGEELILTGIKHVLDHTPYPVIVNGKVINPQTVGDHSALNESS